MGVLVCFAWAVSLFVKSWTNEHTLFRTSSGYLGQRTVLMSERTMTKLDWWLQTVAVQRMCSREDKSFEMELEQGRFWRTTSSGPLPRGLIRDYPWWVDGGSGAQLPNRHTYAWKHTHTLAVSLSLCLAHTLSHAGLQQGRDGASEHDRVQK